MDAVKQDKHTKSLSASIAGPLVRSSAVGSAKKEKCWVAVRIRPLLELEQLAKERIAWKSVGSNTLQHVDPEKPAAQCPSYQYNRVFSESSSNEHVYAGAAQGLVAASMRGYNSTIFAYGQTGSGKTYTMQGIMAQAAKDVFQLISEDSSREFIIRMAAVEIYNEVVRDLLKDSSPGLKLLDDPLRGTVAENLSEAGVQSEQHLQQLLAEVESRRQTRATRMNDNSSRSHEIVRLYIESRPANSSAGPAASDRGDADGAADVLPEKESKDAAAAGAAAASDEQQAGTSVTTATINFVDLAGSERASQSAEVGEKEKLRQKEAGNINKSLLTLSSVIRALADNPGKRHVPYRDSKLTRLLQSSLSGNSYMTIITTISPAAGSADNTRAALHFATAAGRVVMRPQLNQVSSSKAVIRAMAAEIMQLKAQLDDMDAGKLEAALQLKEAEAAATAQERDALRSKLQMLQNQILRGEGAPAKEHQQLQAATPLTPHQPLLQPVCVGVQLRASFDNQGLWSNRVALARELRASSMGVRSSWAPGDAELGRDAARDIGRPATSGGMSSIAGASSAFGAAAGLQQLRSQDVARGSQVRRSMRLLDCYLPREGAERPSSSPCMGQQQQQQQPVQIQQQRQRPKQQQRMSQHRQQQGRQPPGASILEAVVAQQQQQQQQQQTLVGDAATHQQQQPSKQQQQQQPGSRLNPARMRPEESQRAMQIQKLQEPSGPEAEAAMAGLEVEVRCYKHVQEYTLAELSAALEHLECQQATGQGLGSWSDDQLDALRSEVARKRAAEALTQLGDRALDALTRKVNSYTSSADGSPFGDLRRQLVDVSSREASMLDTPAAAAALASAAAAAAGVAGQMPWQVGPQEGRDRNPSPDLPVCQDDEGSWPDVAPRLMSGRVTPTLVSRRGVGRPASVAGRAPAPGTASAAAAAAPAAASRQAMVSPSEDSTSSSAGGPSSSSSSSRRSTVSPVGSAAAVAAQELVRMQEAWRESVEKDVSCLREVLAQYKEQVERLEMQKKLLLSQVLKLEFSLEEEEGHVLELRHELQQAQRERDAARAAAAAAATSTSAAAAGATSATDGAAGVAAPAAAGMGAPGMLPAINTSPPLNNLSIYDACSDGGWADTPTVDSLLPKIVALWEELYVPLAYRSRFFLSFRGREVFYYEVEARRLEWKRSQMLAGATEEPSAYGSEQHLARGSYGGSTMEGAGGPPSTPPAGMRGAGGSSTPRPFTSASAAAALTASSSFGGMRRRSRQLDRAARALDWERKSLAAGLKWNLTETEREELYRAWGVDPDTKERKLQLVFKLWSKETLQQPDGMARSSELVVMLCGMDASEHMMELVFGSHLREYSAAGLPLNRTSTSGLGYAVSNIVRRLAPPLARTGMGGSPMRSSMSVGGGAGVGYGPARAGGSFTSRIQSGFLSLLSSKDRPEGVGGLTSQQLAGMGGGNVQSREGSFSSMASSMHYRRH